MTETNGITVCHTFYSLFPYAQDGSRIYKLLMVCPNYYQFHLSLIFSTEMIDQIPNIYIYIDEL